MAKTKAREYEVKTSGTAYVTTTYRVYASSREEAEAKVANGDVEAFEEEIVEKTETYFDTTPSQ